MFAHVSAMLCVQVFCVLHRFSSYLFIYFSQREVLIFCLPKARAIQVALSSTVCPQDETVCVCVAVGSNWTKQFSCFSFWGRSSRWTCMERTHLSFNTQHTPCSHSLALHAAELMNGSRAAWRVGVLACARRRAAYV